MDPAERGKFSNIGLLHPVLHFFVDGNLVDECHMYEDIYAEWNECDFGFCFQPALSNYVGRLLA